MLNAKFLQPTANSRANYHLIQIRIQFHLNQEVKFISRKIYLRWAFIVPRLSNNFVHNIDVLKMTVLLYNLDENSPYYSSRNLCICVICRIEKYDVMLLFYFAILISIKSNKLIEFIIWIIQKVTQFSTKVPISA